MKDKERIKQKENVPVEHVFNNNKFCDISWCDVLKAQCDNHSYVAPENRHLYDKIVDKDIYKQLSNIFEKFKRIDVLAESMHFFDTQLNKALNMFIACKYPNFKHMGQIMTLTT